MFGAALGIICYRSTHSIPRHSHHRHDPPANTLQGPIPDHRVSRIGPFWVNQAATPFLPMHLVGRSPSGTARFLTVLYCLRRAMTVQRLDYYANFPEAELIGHYASRYLTRKVTAIVDSFLGFLLTALITGDHTILNSPIEQRIRGSCCSPSS